MLASPETSNVTTSVSTAGQGSSFVRAFNEEAKFVWNSLRRFGVKRADLEDLTHEVFIAVHRHWHEYDTSRPLRPWLFGFAYRTAHRYRDLVRHDREVQGEVPDTMDPASDAEQRLDLARKQAMLQAALERLPMDQRAVFILHDVDDTPIPEVAEGLGIPLNTAYSRLRLARAAIKKLVGGVA
jgi:RNA polymerase sigma-70 factor, ECF subfamily